MSVPAPLTIYQQIRKLPPAHVLVRDARARAIERYWSLDYTPKLDDRRGRSGRAKCAGC